MKLVLTLVAMAVLAWIIATQLNTAKVVATHDGNGGVIQGTPAQLEQQAASRVNAAYRAEEKNAADKTAAAAAAANQ